MGADVIQRIYRLVSRDEGGRNIGRLVKACNESLMRAATTLLASKRVLILSGFPCHVDDDVTPQESDGPSGALCVARALAFRSTNVTIMTDNCNVSVFEACKMASIRSARTARSRNMMKSVEIESFSPSFRWSETRSVDSMLRGFDAIISLERTGANKDGHYLTMSGRQMDRLVAPLDELFAKAGDIPTIAIGDGGNELGMGGMSDIIKEDIHNGKSICCVVPSDMLIPCSVSNWGGYALAGAIGVLHAMNDPHDDHRLVLPTLVEEEAIVDGGVGAGMRDGVTGRRERTVDGLPWSASSAVLRGVTSLLLQSASHSHAAQATPSPFP